MTIPADGFAGREYEPFDVDLPRWGVSSALLLWYMYIFGFLVSWVTNYDVGGWGWVL